MQAFRLQNFRGFRDTGWIQLKPLTLLVGANSTGKSSLLRFLPLLRQSMATETGVPFAWAKEGGVDMGTAQDVHRRGATEPMRVGIWAETFNHLSSVKFKQSHSIEGVNVQFELSLDSKTSVGEVHKFTVDSGRFRSNVLLGQGHRRVEGAFDTNHKWLGPITFRGGVIPDALYVEDTVISKFRELILSIVSPPPEGFTDEQEQSQFLAWGKRPVLIRSLHLPPKDFRDLLQDVILPGQTITKDDQALIDVQAHLWDLTLGSLLSDVRSSLMLWSQSIEYIGPARFPPMRYHRMWAERPRRLMPDGANLAVLFGGLSPRDRDEFNSTLKSALGYTLSLRSGTGNAELNLTNAEGETFNIADLGFGLSQVLPVYLQAHLAQRNMVLSRASASLFVVEQPELHLHPQLQAKLADLFVGMSAYSEANPSPVPCFVETHSKALLERTGELVEEGAIPAEDVQVLLFEKDGKDCTVRTTTFDEQGILLDWPVGFLSR